ncbi:MAG: DUF2007 domain-containing protein [Crocinitomicaceae bacterium]|nr:DUF2007 domain-containing protein [Flavobacteriales bacterium]NQZ36533.1 DUF2007 domain-containing protein [Crocinitomicaceae bacterium]PHR30021.1 MAG: hypothetical protein COA38_10870 [Fluviicola sp.]
MKLVKEPKWVSVYESYEEYTVHIKKLTLEDAGIPVTIFDQRDSSYNAFGYVYLHVPVELEEKALQVLKEHA